MLIDISQEVFNCCVFPGDPQPVNIRAMSIAAGDICNLTELKMCAHNGTHIDAPYHFIDSGKTVDEMPLESYIGDCFVAQEEGEISADKAERILEKARAAGAEKRILIGGKAVVSEAAAQVFADAGIVLIGNESQTVGPEDDAKAVHLILLGREVTLLEGIRLGGVEEGRYFLMAQPLNLGGCDGAPCRAVLMK